MSRINFPNPFAGIVKLFRDVKAKYDAEAGASKLQPYLDEQGIDMTVDETIVNTAVAADTAFGIAGKEAERLHQKRNFLFDPVFKQHEGEVQFLKKLYRNNVGKLGDWGVTVDSGDRVVYPTDFVGQQSAVLVFIAKHDSFPVGTSPLQPYLDENTINIATGKTASIEALTAHNAFLVQDNVREEKRMERDVKIAPVETHLRGEGQFLMGLFHSVPKKANEWGFEVDDSPQGDVTRVGEINPGATKTLRNLVVGKIFKNIGPVPVNLYSGGEAVGTATVLNAGEEFTVVRGYGIMTVINTSNKDKGLYQGEFNT